MNHVLFSGPMQVEENDKGAVAGTVGTVPVYVTKPEMKETMLGLNGQNVAVTAIASARESNGRYFANILINDVAPVTNTYARGEFLAYGVLESVRVIKDGIYEMLIDVLRNGRSYKVTAVTKRDESPLIGQNITVTGTVSGRDGRFLNFQVESVTAAPVAELDDLGF